MKFYLFSESDLKREAIEQVLFEKEHELICIEPGDTKCPQPIGLQSAFKCAKRRVNRELPSDSLAIVVENFISNEKNEPLTDKVLILLTTKNGSVCFHSVSNKNFSVVIPAHFSKLLPKMDIQEPLGSSVTLGETIRETHAARTGTEVGAPPKNDWYRYVDSKNPSRAEQISHTFHFLFQQYNTTMVLPSKMKIYSDFPKPGVEFADVFSLLTDPKLTKQVCWALTNTIETVVAGRDKKDFVIVGLESKGLMFGLLVAKQLGISFVPLRKKNKLPRNDKWKIRSESYSTEYSKDTFELQPHHIGFRGKRFIVVDDFVASGGSLNAAINLLLSVGGKIESPVVLGIIPGFEQFETKIKVKMCW